MWSRSHVEKGQFIVSSTGKRRNFITHFLSVSGKSQSGCEGSYRVATGDSCELDRRCFSSVMCLAVPSIDHFKRRKSFLSHIKSYVLITCPSHPGLLGTVFVEHPEVMA